jgi:hypothetical protein
VHSLGKARLGDALPLHLFGQLPRDDSLPLASSAQEDVRRRLFSLPAQLAQFRGQYFEQGPELGREGLTQNLAMLSLHRAAMPRRAASGGQSGRHCARADLARHLLLHVIVAPQCSQGLQFLKSTPRRLGKFSLQLTTTRSRTKQEQ